MNRSECRAEGGGQRTLTFNGFDTTQVAATAAGGFAPCVFQGDCLGATYTGPGRGA